MNPNWHPGAPPQNHPIQSSVSPSLEHQAHVEHRDAMMLHLPLHFYAELEHFRHSLRELLDKVGMPARLVLRFKSPVPIRKGDTVPAGSIRLCRCGGPSLGRRFVSALVAGETSFRMDGPNKGPEVRVPLSDVEVLYVGDSDDEAQHAQNVALAARNSQQRSVADLVRPGDTLTVTMVTKPDVENLNGIIFSPEACERLAELMREHRTPEIMVTEGYQDSGINGVDLRHAAGTVVPGTARFDGERITVGVKPLNTPAGLGMASKLESQKWYVGHRLEVDDPLHQGRRVTAAHIKRVMNLSLFPTEPATAEPRGDTTCAAG